MIQEERSRNTTITVGTDAVEVGAELGFNAQRKVIILTNKSTGGQTITITTDTIPTAGAGVVLSVGGYYQDSMDVDYKPSNGRIYAISSAAGGTLAVHERIVMQVINGI